MMKGWNRFFGLSGLRASPAPIGPCASGFVFVMPVFTMSSPAFVILIPSAGKGLISRHGRSDKFFHDDDAGEPIMEWVPSKSR
jgi:hypothetical protein